jgi:hypothetical protein
MPRDGAVILADVRASTLSMVCERCGRYGRYEVRRLIAVHAPTRSCLSFWLRWPTARRRARSASTTDVRRALTGFAGESEDHVGIALTRAAHLVESVDEFPIEPDPNQSVGTRARRRVGGA